MRSSDRCQVGRCCDCRPVRLSQPRRAGWTSRTGTEHRGYLQVAAPPAFPAPAPRWDADGGSRGSEAGARSSAWTQHLARSGARDQQRAAAKEKVPEINSRAPVRSGARGCGAGKGGRELP